MPEPDRRSSESDHGLYRCGCFQNTGQGWWNEGTVAQTIRTPCGGDSVKANLVVTYQKVVGALTMTDYKGIGKQYIDQDKVVCYSKTRFAEYKRVESTSPLRTTGADVGGGSEALIVQSASEKPDQGV